MESTLNYQIENYKENMIFSSTNSKIYYLNDIMLGVINNTILCESKDINLLFKYIRELTSELKNYFELDVINNFYENLCKFKDFCVEKGFIIENQVPKTKFVTLLDQFDDFKIEKNFLSIYKVYELKSICKLNNIKFTSKDKKSDLINHLVPNFKNLKYPPKL